MWVAVGTLCTRRTLVRARTPGLLLEPAALMMAFKVMVGSACVLSSARFCFPCYRLGGGHALLHNLVLGGTPHGPHCGHCAHQVSMDVVGRALHCYQCDDYCFDAEAAWLDALRGEIEAAEALPLPEDVGGVPVEDEEGAVHHGCTGLLNLGNTCFLNSTLQAFSHCTAFRDFFLDFLKAEAPLQVGKVKIARQLTRVLKEEVETYSGDHELAEELHALLRVLWNGSWRSVAPHDFVKSVWADYGWWFTPRQQHDASEFASFLLARLDEGLGQDHTPDHSVMHQIFGLHQEQTITCDVCEQAFSKVEPLLGVQLALPEPLDDPPSLRQPWQREFAPPESSTSPQLHECFASMLRLERLEGDDKFQCTTCGCKRTATRTVRLCRRPPALLISLRRTGWSAKRGAFKDSRHVSFPTVLDASELLTPAFSDPPTEPNQPHAHYRLAGLVSHSGIGATVGHYTAHARAGHDASERWFHFNDSYVTEASESQVLRQEAYMLMYEQCTLEVATADAERSKKEAAAVMERDAAAAAAAAKVRARPYLNPTMAETVKTIAGRGVIGAEAIAALLKLDLAAVRAVLGGGGTEATDDVNESVAAEKVRAEEAANDDDGEGGGENAAKKKREAKKRAAARKKAAATTKGVGDGTVPIVSTAAAAAAQADVSEIKDEERAARNAPVIDDDGFQSVPTRRGRGKPQCER